MRGTMWREEIKEGKERTVFEKRVPEALSDLTESVFGTLMNILPTGGFTEFRGEGMPCESCETVQQRRSAVGHRTIG